MAFTEIKDIAYYQAHLDEAMALVNGRCKNYNHDDVFTKDAECMAAHGAVEKDIQAKQRDVVLKGLYKKKQKLADDSPMKDGDKDRYEAAKSNFAEDVETAGDFVADCFKSDRRVTQNGVECNAAVDFMIENLEKINKEEVARLEKEHKYKEYYQRFFREDVTRIDAVLEGRCKAILANEWYPYDPQLQDKECNAALEEKNRQKKLAAHLDDVDKKAEDESKKCVGGVEQGAACAASKISPKDKEQEEKRKAEYTEFYKGHILAAKFHLRWCRGAMVIFDDECNTVEAILKDHKDRPLNPKLQKKYEGYFATNPLEARIAVLGICADRLADSWYYLDKNLQTEECNAAAEVAGK